jgi:hypothetical protein
MPPAVVTTTNPVLSIVFEGLLKVVVTVISAFPDPLFTETEHQEGFEIAHSVFDIIVKEPEEPTPQSSHKLVGFMEREGMSETYPLKYFRFLSALRFAILASGVDPGQ